MRILLAAAALLFSAGPGLAQTATDQTPSADPGVLFWAPAKREQEFRRMDTLVPHGTVTAGGPASPLPRGEPLELDPSAFIEDQRAAGVLVIQNGKVRLEAYGLGMTPDDRWVSFSMTKSLVSTLVGAAIADGHIDSLDDPVTRYLPEMVGSGYDGVTVRQLVTMTSGVAWNEDYTDPDADVARMLVVAPDPGVDATISYMRRLPRATEPGTRWNYNTGETNLVGVLIARATGKPLEEYLSEKIWTPAGMERDGAWLLDAGGKAVGGCCVSATLRDWGRVGELMLDRGMIGETSVTPEGWFDEAATTQAEIGVPGRGYGFLWWTFDTGVFQARGIFGQTIHMDPSRDLVIVILSAWPVATGDAQGMARNAFLAEVTRAVDATPQD